MWAVIWGSCSAASSTPDLYTSLQITMSSAKTRTTDHIFTLHTLIDKYINQNKTKIFACFVDFQKAFDSIWHEGLLSKLLESGIGGNIYNIIKTMYSNNQCAIKIGNKRTEFFTQGQVWGRAVHYHRPSSISTLMNWPSPGTIISTWPHATWLQH